MQPAPHLVRVLVLGTADPADPPAFDWTGRPRAPTALVAVPAAGGDALLLGAPAGVGERLRSLGRAAAPDDAGLDPLAVLLLGPQTGAAGLADLALRRRPWNPQGPAPPGAQERPPLMALAPRALAERIAASLPEDLRDEVEVRPVRPSDHASIGGLTLEAIGSERSGAVGFSLSGSRARLVWLGPQATAGDLRAALSGLGPEDVLLAPGRLAREALSILERTSTRPLVRFVWLRREDEVLDPSSPLARRLDRFGARAALALEAFAL